MIKTNYWQIDEEVSFCFAMPHHQLPKHADTNLRSKGRYWSDADARSAATARGGMILVSLNAGWYE